MQKLILTILALALTPVGCWAETPKDSWENLKQLQPGHKIKVVDKSLKSWDGRLVSVTDEAITIREKWKQQEVSVERANVLRVTDLERSKRGRNALIGLAIGTALGAAIIGNEDDIVPWGKAVIAIGIFGAPGAGIGAAIPYTRPSIYRSKNKPTRIGTDSQD